MKKLISAILSICILSGIACTFSSCGEQPLEIDYSDKYIENQDYQYMYADGFGHSSFQKSDNGYYAAVNNFIFYIDGKTMNATPLCNKSNCLHDKETDSEKLKECNAYVPDYAEYTRNSIQLYNKKLYFLQLDSADSAEDIDKYLFYEMDTESGSRKLLLTYIDGKVNFWAVHRGNIYFKADNFISSDDSGELKAQNGTGFNKMFRLKLGESSPEVIYDFEKTDGIYKIQLSNSFTVYGNHIYIGYSGYKNEEAYNKVISADEKDFESIASDVLCGYVHIDITNDKSTVVLDGNEENSKVFNCFYNDKICYSQGNSVYILELDGRNSELLADNIDGIFLSDGKRNYTSIFDTDDIGQDVQSVMMLDERLKKKSIFAMPDNFFVQGIVQMMCPYDDNYIWGFVENNGSTDIVYIEKSQLDSDPSQLKAKTVYSCKNSIPAYTE